MRHPGIKFGFSCKDKHADINDGAYTHKAHTPNSAVQGVTTKSLVCAIRGAPINYERRVDPFDVAGASGELRVADDVLRRSF